EACEDRVVRHRAVQQLAVLIEDRRGAAEHFEDVIGPDCEADVDAAASSKYSCRFHSGEDALCESFAEAVEVDAERDLGLLALHGLLDCGARGLDLSRRRRRGNRRRRSAAASTRTTGAACTSTRGGRWGRGSLAQRRSFHLARSLGLADDGGVNYDLLV